MSKQLAAQEAGIEPVSRGGFQTLADIVQTLIDITDLLEVATDEERPVVEEELQRVIGMELATKVDGLGLFDKRCNAEVAILQDFIKEAQIRIDSWEKKKKRIRDLAKWSMAKLGVARIKGRMFSINVRAGAESLRLKDEALVPDEYKTVSVQMPLLLWQATFKSLLAEVADAVSKGADIQISCDKSAVKRDLKTKPIAGAELARGEEILTVR